MALELRRPARTRLRGPLCQVDPQPVTHSSSTAPVRLGRPAVRLLTPDAVRGRQLPGGWPLKYLLLGFPLWWVLGLNTLIFPIMAVPMARQLLRRDRVRFPPGMSLWWLFLAWQIIGLAAFGLSPPTTHPGSTGGRLVSIAFTLVQYVGVTITLLYVGNLARQAVSQTAIARWMGGFFLTVFAGGMLGVVAPTFQFTSVVELLLPGGVRANAFVQALVHPVAAQVQDVIGDANGRPSAPFGYTNSWGNALSILVVWFVAAWVLPARGRRRVALWLVVALSVVPIVLSLNRGLWVGIGFTVVWLTARLFLQRRIGHVVAILGILVLSTVAFLISPLAPVISARLDNGVSNDIRTFVADKSLIAIEHSPVLGYGGPRRADGSNSSITIGPTASCPNCGDVPTGSTGQLWSVLFNNGLFGTALYFGFFLVSLWVYRRQRGRTAEAALVTIALGFVYMLFYSALPVAPTLTMIAVGLLWRQRDADAAQDGAGQDGAGQDGAGQDGADARRRESV